MSRARKRTLVVAGLALSLILFSFQNCSQVNLAASGAPAGAVTTTSTPPVNPGGNSNISYSWVTSGYGACSKTCGGGTQIQTVVCQRNDGVAVDGSLCPGNPPAVSQTCNNDACEVEHWVAGGYGACSVTCGGGTQTRSVTCENSNGSTVSDSLCSGAAPAPSQSCNAQACPSPLVALSAGGIVFHAGGNTGTIAFQLSGNSLTGIDNFPNWSGVNIFGQNQNGITCSDTGSFTVTSSNSGTIQFVRSNCNGQSYEPQQFVGTWTTPDFVHVQISGNWTWQLPNSYMPGGGPWDAEN